MIGSTSGSWLPMSPLCCGFLAAPVAERAESLVFLSLFFHQIYRAWCPLRERNEPTDRGKHQSLPLFFFSFILYASTLLPFPSPSLSVTLSSRSSFLSDTPKLLLCFSKQISCKCSPFDLISPFFFSSTSWEKFPRKPGSFVAGGFVRVSLVRWEQRAQRLESLLKMGVGGCRGCGGGNQFSLRITPSFTCASR